MLLMPRATPTPPPALETEPRVRRGYFEFRHGQLHVHTAIPPGGGFEEGVPLVCLHGTSGTGRAFKGLLPLAGRDRSVYAPDLPGCGESDPLPQAAPATADYAQAIGDFLDNMRLRQLDLLACGTGAALATELALARVAQVRRLVLVSVPLGADIARELSRPGASPALAGALTAYPLRERLGRLTQPVLLLRPRDEWWDATARVREALPAARLVDLPELGADLLEAAPRRVAEAVREFLRR